MLGVAWSNSKRNSLGFVTLDGVDLEVSCVVTYPLLLATLRLFSANNILDSLGFLTVVGIDAEVVFREATFSAQYGICTSVDPGLAFCETTFLPQYGISASVTDGLEPATAVDITGGLM